MKTERVGEPDHPEVLRRLVIRLQQCDAHEEALAHLDRALAADSTHPGWHALRAISLGALERSLDALASCARACVLAPDRLDYLYNFGLLCARLCCPAQTEAIARHLLARRPDWPAAQYLLVRALTEQGRHDAGLARRYDALVKADPLNAELRFARALFLLGTGNYRTGWEEHEWRWEIEPLKSSRPACGVPRWNGGPLAGRRLLVQGEQGFGDILQFARYLPALAAQAAAVILQLDADRAALARLLGRIDGLEIVIGREALPACDFHCPLASLPYLCDTTPASIPPARYLEVAETDAARWRALLRAWPRPWTGICWAGSGEHHYNIRRSLPLCPESAVFHARQTRERHIAAMTAAVASACRIEGMKRAAARDGLLAHPTLCPLLLRTPGSLVSLQMGPPALELDDAPPALRGRIATPLPAHADFYDTACLVAALDEVIAVDTAVAHLAGSLGKPVRLIKPAAPEWRWAGRDGQAAWYPEMRLLDYRSLAASAGSAQA